MSAQVRDPAVAIVSVIASAGFVAGHATALEMHHPEDYEFEYRAGFDRLIAAFGRLLRSLDAPDAAATLLEEYALFSDDEIRADLDVLLQEDRFQGLLDVISSTLDGLAGLSNAWRQHEDVFPHVDALDHVCLAPRLLAAVKDALKHRAEPVREPH